MILIQASMNTIEKSLVGKFPNQNQSKCTVYKCYIFAFKPCFRESKKNIKTSEPNRLSYEKQTFDRIKDEQVERTVTKLFQNRSMSTLRLLTSPKNFAFIKWTAENFTILFPNMLSLSNEGSNHTTEGTATEITFSEIQRNLQNLFSAKMFIVKFLDFQRTSH